MIPPARRIMPVPSAELVGALTTRLKGGIPVPGLTRGRLMGLLMLAVTGVLAAAGGTIAGIIVIGRLFDLVESTLEVAVMVTVRLAVRVPVGGV
jgi:hypothetical protein